MIRKIVCALLCLSASAGFAQSVTGGGIATQFNQWRVVGSVNLIAGANPGVVFSPCLVQGDPNHTIPAVSASTPLLIKDPGNPSIDETVTPTAIVFNPAGCTATLTTANAHTTPWYVVSGSFGLQEAINNITQSGVLNAITLDYKWHQSGGTASTIYNATGNPYMAIEDTTIKPEVSYGWNTSTSHYIPIFSINGVAASAIAAGAAAGTAPTVANSALNGGNVITANVTTGTATTTGTLFTETPGTAKPTGPLNCTVQNVGANVPPAFTLSSTTSVLTVSVAVAPPTATAYIFAIECE